MIEARRRRLLVDGRPTIVLSGEVHYFRLARDEWPYRLDLAREVGCTAVASYIPWLFHELPDGTLDVVGSTRSERDVAAFIDLCAEHGLSFIARPGPFVMAELKNEGIPYRIYREHPEIVPTGWDGRPSATHTVDYLAPAFLAETRRWYGAVLPLIAARLEPAGGNVIAVQLDNEVGMLDWVANSPSLTDGVLSDLRRWCATRHPDLSSRYPIDLDDPQAWRRAVEAPDEAWAAALRVDLALFMRERFARYVAALAAMAAEFGISGVPLLVNVHGTEGGEGVSFGIGISQLLEALARVPGIVAGSDHYLGEERPVATADMHFINASMAAVTGEDQPLTSIEFEAGLGDYAGGFEHLTDPRTVELRTRLCLAQGNRLINYYLLAGGRNPPLDEPVGDGTDRIGITGERHGAGAPIGPEGQRGLAFASLHRTCSIVATHARWLADQDAETDDLAVAFLPDAFATEYRYPPSTVMAEAVGDLGRYRGPGARRVLWRSLLLAGFRFGAVNLQDPHVALPTLLCLSSGEYLDASVQRRLVEFLAVGGRLLHVGRLPQRDLEGRPCTLLTDALGVAAGRVLREHARYFPSVVSTPEAPAIAETRVPALQELVPQTSGSTGRSGFVPLLTDVEGRICGLEATLGAGRAVLISAELPAMPDFFSGLVARLGIWPALRLTTSVPGVTALTTRAPGGDRMLHLLNPTGYDAAVSISLDGELLSPEDWLVPARSGHMVALGLTTEWGRIERATSEVTALNGSLLAFAPSLTPGGHLIVLRTEREILPAGGDSQVVVRRDREFVVVSSARSGGSLVLEIG